MDVCVFGPRIITGSLKIFEHATLGSLRCGLKIRAGSTSGVLASESDSVATSSMALPGDSLQHQWRLSIICVRKMNRCRHRSLAYPASRNLGTAAVSAARPCQCSCMESSCFLLRSVSVKALAAAFGLQYLHLLLHELLNALRM